MHEALHEIYNREHGMSLDALQNKTKKQVRQYLETIPGAPSYVISQVTLLSFGGHAMPIDDALADAMREAKCVEPDATTEEITGFVERHVKAAEGMATHLTLRAWIDENTKPIDKTTKKKTTKKKTTKAS